MNTTGKENLKELFEKFLEPQQAIEAAEDILKGEQILHENPAPEPDEELIANIKRQINVKISGRQRKVYKSALKIAAVAATIAILALIGVRLYKASPPRGGEPKKYTYASIVPTSVWESEDIVADDVKFAFFTEEIEQIENQLKVLQFGEYSENGDRALAELEMELLEINSDFWKG
jgi:hypothetical protein